MPPADLPIGGRFRSGRPESVIRVGTSVICVTVRRSGQSIFAKKKQTKR